MDKKYSPPTMKDVAREAGVALGTVSKVLNGIRVGESYRVRVEDAAKRLGYQVNAYARALRTNKSHLVALILPDLHNPFFAMLSDEVCRALGARGYQMLLRVTDCDKNAEQDCIRMVLQSKVDGIIALTYNPDLEVKENIPFVSVDRYFRAEIPCVSADNYSGGQLAAEKLISLGCRRLVFFRTGSRVAGSADSRGDGFAAFCLSRSVPYDAVRLEDGESPARFRDYLREHLVDGKPDFDGAFCSTDRLALEIKSLLEEYGVRVPEDVQLIGFDGVRAFGSGDLLCSTIVQPVQQIAAACVELLLKEDRSCIPSRVYLPVSYAPGGTTRETAGERE